MMQHGEMSAMADARTATGNASAGTGADAAGAARSRSFAAVTPRVVGVP